LSRLLQWFKKYWKWIFFPVGAAVGLAALLARRSPPPVKDTDQVVRGYIERLRSADETRNKRLEELAVEKEKQLQALGVAQQKELEQLQDAPIEDVVSWFNRL
jgi:hypothetical protein